MSTEFALDVTINYNAFFSYKVDVVFGKNCGFQTLLVGTGLYNMQDVLKLRENPKENQKQIPDFYLEKLGDLLQFL